MLFGIAGLGLIVPALLIVGGIGSAPPDGTEVAGAPSDPRTELLASLEESRAAVADAAVTARGAGGALDAAGAAAGSAAGFTAELSATLRGLSAALRTPILGAAPFAPIAGQFEAVADRGTALASDLDAVRTSIDTSSADLAALAGRLDRLEDRIGSTAEAVEGVSDGGLATLRLLGMALLGWLAVPAAAALWIGARWLGAEGTSAPRSAAPRGA